MRLLTFSADGGYKLGIKTDGGVISSVAGGEVPCRSDDHGQQDQARYDRKIDFDEEPGHQSCAFAKT